MMTVLLIWLIFLYLSLYIFKQVKICTLKKIFMVGVSFVCGTPAAGRCTCAASTEGSWAMDIKI